jgi:pyruvate dehydrogenase E1 component beta subunit
MIIAAIEDDNPVIIIEHRWCHYIQGEVPEGYYVTPLDGPKKLRSGKDITVVSTSFMTLEVMHAAEALEEMGFSTEVFDLRVLRPLNLQKVFESVSLTGRLITVDTGFQKFGIGAEIVSEVISNCFSSLKAAPVRIGMPEHPSPSSRGFLPGLYPDASRIVKEAAHMLGIEDKQLNKAIKTLGDNRGDLSIDVPDPRFKGPF